MDIPDFRKQKYQLRERERERERDNNVFVEMYCCSNSTCDDASSVGKKNGASHAVSGAEERVEDRDDD